MTRVALKIVPKEEAPTTMKQLEAVIERGQTAGLDTAKALAEIRARKLYRDDGYKSWKRYCRERWDYSESYANQLVNFAKHTATAVEKGLPVPANEYQSRGNSKAKKTALKSADSPHVVAYLEGIQHFRRIVLLEGHQAAADREFLPSSKGHVIALHAELRHSFNLIEESFHA